MGPIPGLEFTPEPKVGLRPQTITLYIDPIYKVGVKNFFSSKPQMPRYLFKQIKYNLRGVIIYLPKRIYHVCIVSILDSLIGLWISMIVK
jgi:hypothetical protein